MSMQVKDISSLMNRNVASAVGITNQSSGAVSFEAVWNNQTQRNQSSEHSIGEQKNLSAEEDVEVRDSLKMKQNPRTIVKECDTVEETTPSDIKDMTPEEWEEAMEVLGTAATELIQRIANAFDMTVEEVQGLMADLGMEQLDVLQQQNLSELLLSAAGAEDMTSLLTDEELYVNYQAIMGQLNTLLEQSSETLQMDVGQLMQMATELTGTNRNTESPMVEISVDVEVPEKNSESFEDVKTQNITGESSHNLHNLTTESTSKEQMQGQDGNQMQSQDADQNQVQNPNQVQNNEQLQNQNELQSQGQMKEQTNSQKEVADDKGQNNNLLIQNFKTQSFEPQLQQLSHMTQVWDADTMDVMKQIMDYMKIQVKPDMSNLEMQLHPESLGTLQIHVASKGGSITAQFVTQNETVKAALESQMIQLKESFAEQGVKVDAIEVTVQTHQFEQNLEQGRGGNQSEPDRRNRTRRIQLDGALSIEQLDAMEEEEQLAAQMMAANGNTVDYTA